MFLLSGSKAVAVIQVRKRHPEYQREGNASGLG